MEGSSIQRNLKNPYQSLLQSTPFSKHQAAPIVTCSSGKYPKTSRNMTSWWFQPIWKIWVKMGSSSPNMGENKFSWTSTAFFRDTDWQLGSPWKSPEKTSTKQKKSVRQSSPLEISRAWLLPSSKKDPMPRCYVPEKNTQRFGVTQPVLPEMLGVLGGDRCFGKWQTWFRWMFFGADFEIRKNCIGPCTY